MKYLCLNIFLFVFQIYFGQSNKIQEINLSNEVLVQNLKKFIADTRLKNLEFNNIGYIEVKLFFFNSDAKENDIKIKYRIKDQYFKPDYKKDILPSYYCYLEGKLILLYDLTKGMFLRPNYEKKYQKRLNKIIKPYLKEPVHIKAKDKQGNTIIDDKNFIEETLNIHGGIILSIKNNNEFEVLKYNP